MALLRVLYPNGKPASGKQIIIKNPGTTDYGITNAEGYAEIPHKYDSGSVIVNGKVVHIGELTATIYLN